jgi:hypothetical protein
MAKSLKEEQLPSKRLALAPKPALAEEDVGAAVPSSHKWK